MARKKAQEEEEASTSSSEHETMDHDSEDEQDDNSSEEHSESEEQSDDDGSDEEEEEEESAETPAPAATTDGEASTFALADLTSFNTHQINASQLYSPSTSTDTVNHYNNATISTSIAINESYLLSKAVVGTKQLLKQLWKCPSDKSADGGFMVAKLPGRSGKVDGYVLPRMLPPPPQKQLTKWEKFALERGISPKSKKSRKQFDEATGEWKHLTGSLHNKANAGPESWPILEVKKNDDPNQDPWEKLRQEKKDRVNKNTANRMKNAESAGLLEKGSANRMVKQHKKMEKQRTLSREHERQAGIAAPAGVPIDMMKSATGTGTTSTKLRGKQSIQLALQATQVSTASLGKFDKMREGEPERKLEKHTKKRKLLLSEKSTEQEKSRDILSKVMNGSKEKDRDVKKGKYAKGETAYDYDYDDGLGAGSFRKKKGRAGVGKMRKITKKRIK